MKPNSARHRSGLRGNRLVSSDPCSSTYVDVAVQLALDLYSFRKFRPESHDLVRKVHKFRAFAWRVLQLRSRAPFGPCHFYYGLD